MHKGIVNVRQPLIMWLVNRLSSWPNHTANKLVTTEPITYASACR